MSVRVEVKPALLDWARARSGIDDETWVKRFPRFDDWRSGATHPTLKQLQEFAQKTHAPVGFLLLDTPPIESVPIPDFRTVGGQPVGARGTGAVSGDLLDVVYACQRRQEWYRDHQLLDGEAPLPFVGTATTASDVGGVASTVASMLDWSAANRRGCADAVGGRAVGGNLQFPHLANGHRPGALPDW